MLRKYKYLNSIVSLDKNEPTSNRKIKNIHIRYPWKLSQHL